MNNQEKIIKKHKGAIAPFVNIGVTAEEISCKVNAYDWFDLQEAKDENDIIKVMETIFNKFNFKIKPNIKEIVTLAFYHKFLKAIVLLKDGIEHVKSSYTVPNDGVNFENEVVNKYYYLNYWADKKNIPINVNEKDQAKRDLFNFDTIILSILADKLNSYNNYERNKPKK